MPIGSSTRGTTTGWTPSTRNSVFTLSAKKFAYLKMPRTTRFGGHGEGQQRLRAARVAPAIDGDRHRVVERDRRQHQQREPAAALRVEDDARDEQQPVAVPAVDRRRVRERRRTSGSEIQRQQDRQEQKQERRFGEQHDGGLPPSENEDVLPRQPLVHVIEVKPLGFYFQFGFGDRHLVFGTDRDRRVFLSIFEEHETA